MYQTPMNSGQAGLCRISCLNACWKPQRNRQGPVAATKQQTDARHKLPMSWGQGRADGSAGSAEYGLCSLGPCPGTGLLLMPVPSTACLHSQLAPK